MKESEVGLVINSFAWFLYKLVLLWFVWCGDVTCLGVISGSAISRVGSAEHSKDRGEAAPDRQSHVGFDRLLPRRYKDWK